MDGLYGIWITYLKKAALKDVVAVTTLNIRL